ncbi:MAG: 2-amino-4-hydroxy-6-hydroxymethyldihydropteridine diphosphokinase [Synergistaceae bacterium]|nr:2-amino-4-hydroxy-6-hydroxymethyldihydropteridine diphosphokinase [Synergistaceae bacterium]
MSDHKVVLALGANLGNRLEALKKAIIKLESCGIRTEAKSRIWETKPWGVTEQPLFLNMCMTARTDLEPIELLCLLKKTEAELGRSAGTRWGTREIDIDIIYLFRFSVTQGPQAGDPPSAHARTGICTEAAHGDRSRHGTSNTGKERLRTF